MASAAYELRFALPEAREQWISDNEERQLERVLAIKSGFLANIMIYYRADDEDGPSQLRYQLDELRRA